MKDFKKNLIYQHQPLKEALLQLNNIPDTLTLFVLDETECLVGTLTDGDIRRFFLSGKGIESPVKEAMFSNFRYLQKNKYSIEDVAAIKKKGVRLVPFLDDQKRIIRIIDLIEKRSILPFEAVIMAGGKGERLLPLTEKTPKPLLKVGPKPIIEYNIDRLISYGIDKIHISLRYLGNQIEDYFTKESKKDILLYYIYEDQPLGTFGAICNAREFNCENVLVMNSDLLTNIDFEDFFKTFVASSADLCVASIPYNVAIPYAVLETNDERIVDFKEKPNYTYYSNAGIYLLKKNLLDDIPKNTHYNATDFMDSLIKKGAKVVHYPILGYWLDIGKMEDYKKAQEDILHIKL